jgi:hypothetical protein
MVSADAGFMQIVEIEEGEDVAEGMSKITLDIGYSNFKDFVTRQHGHTRTDLHRDRWKILWRTSEEE